MRRILSFNPGRVLKNKLLWFHQSLKDDLRFLNVPQGRLRYLQLIVTFITIGFWRVNPRRVLKSGLSWFHQFLMVIIRFSNVSERHSGYLGLTLDNLNVPQGHSKNIERPVGTNENKITYFWELSTLAVPIPAGGRVKAQETKQKSMSKIQRFHWWKRRILFIPLYPDDR